MRISFWIAVLSCLLGLAGLVMLGWYEAGGDIESLPPFGVWCVVFAALVMLLGIVWLLVQYFYRSDEPDA
jgi:drug/metabolite transporter (DMT)-like permease